jgi:hypothetical protein
MKRITIGLVLLAIMAGAVHAQTPEEQEEKKREENNPLLKEYHEKQKENAKIEQQYQRTLRATDSTAAPVKIDPWANMRGTNETSKKKR